MKLSLPTADGEFVAYYSERGLMQLEFPNKLSHREDTTAVPRADEWHVVTTRALKQILAGKNPEKLPPLDLMGGTEFQHRVWKALQKIATGKTKSYAEIAEEIGSPKAIRAVGAACGANPIPVIIPCHRVLAAGGKLGEFSGGKGWKEKLLARERMQLF